MSKPFGTKNGTKSTHCVRGHEFTAENTYVTNSSNHHPNGMRQCLLCKSERHKEYRKVHHKRMDARAKAWAIAHPDRIREITRKSGRAKLGWTPEMVESKRIEQNNQCAICKKPFDKGKDTHADHKHIDPPVPRGLLCGNCNRGIGNLQDSPELLRAAAEYIESYRL